MSPLFFVHVPKTAGTSFRKAAEVFYGIESVAYDYSLQASETTACVRQWIYEEKDPLSFQQHCYDTSLRFLSGHVPAGKYIHLFGARQTVTFLRDPLQRIVSEYYHFVRHNGYKGDLPSFYRKPQFVNRQSKMMQTVPLSAVGLVGLNEAYDDSLAMINQGYATKFKAVDMNMGRSDKAKIYELPVDQRDEILSLNQDDVRLYRRATRLFKQRFLLFQKGIPYVHGDIQQLSDKSLSGWAWGFENDDAVEVEIHIDGEYVNTCIAKDLRPNLLRLAPPRKGYIGFHYNFDKTLKDGAEVKVLVAKTAQEIGRQKVIRPSK